MRSATIKRQTPTSQAPPHGAALALPLRQDLNFNVPQIPSGLRGQRPRRAHFPLAPRAVPVFLAPMERTSTDWKIVILLFAAGLLAAAQFAKISLSLAPLAQAYRGSAAVPFMVSLLSVMGIALGPVMGGIVTRLGIRRAVLGALALGAAVSLTQALILPLPLMVASRLIEGASHLTLVVALPTLMAEAATPRDKPVVMGLWGTYFGVAFAVLALAIPTLTETGGLPALFAAHGVALAAMALILAPILPRGTARRTPFRPLAEIAAIYTSPRFLAPGLIFLWHAMAFIALLAFLPAALNAPGIAAALPLISLCGTFAAGFAARAIAPALLAAAAFAANIALVLAILALPGAAIPLALAMFFSMGVVPGAGFAAIPWLNRDLPDRARANGALAQFGNIGTFSGTPLMAAAGLSLAPLMAVTGLIAALGLAVSVAVFLRFRRESAT